MVPQKLNPPLIRGGGGGGVLAVEGGAGSRFKGCESQERLSAGKSPFPREALPGGYGRLSRNRSTGVEGKGATTCPLPKREMCVEFRSMGAGLS